MRENIKVYGILDYLKERKKLPLIIGGLLLGIFLLILGGISTSKGEISNQPDALALRAEELRLFEAQLEKEIEVLCESVGGVSDATVMVSFSRGYLVKYTADADGDPTTVGSGSSEEAVFGTLEPPAVIGVGIVCRGGHSAEVQQVLVELVSTALGIPANRVYIAGK
ncbi:MAG: hypothetical protein E7644_00335 [Ruminococcaceae bacterium]|nr:hypothetical protein [Oscillospiraceae bacterium]